MPGHTSARLAVAAFLLAATGIALAPHLFSYVSTSAVVNAPVITLRAPFDGIVRAPSGALSHPVARGETLLSIVTDRSDRTAIAELTARLAGTEGERRALAAQRRELAAMAEALEARRLAYVEHAGAWLAARRAEAQARIDAAELRLADRREEARRNRELASRGALSQVSLVSAEAGMAIAERAVAGERARLAAIGRSQDALADGIAVDDMADGLTPIVSRIDEIALQLAAIGQRERTLAAAAAALADQLAFLETRADRTDSFSPAASTSGIIWKPSPPADMPVLTGDELVRLLDCSQRFLEVAVAERHFERIRIGDTARVRLKGARGWTEGRVTAVRGAGGRFDRPTLAAAAPGVDDRQLSVIVELPPADLSDPAVAGAFCLVGRTADVRFTRSGAGLAARAAALWQDLAARLAPATAHTGAPGGASGPGAAG